MQHVEGIRGRFLGDLYPKICGSVCSRDVLSALHLHIHERGTFDFTPAVEAVERDQTILQEVRDLIQVVFEDIALPDCMVFYGLQDYLNRVGNPFKNTTFGVSDLRVYISADESGEMPVTRASQLFSGCNLASINRLYVSVDGPVRAMNYFSRCAVPDFAEIILNLDNAPANSLYGLFKKASFGMKCKLVVKGNLVGDSVTLQDMLSDTTGTLIVNGSGIVINGREVCVNRYMANAGVRDSFRSPVTISDDTKIYVTTSKFNKPLMLADVLPFYDTCVGCDNVLYAHGLDEFTELASLNYRVYEIKDKLESLGCSFEDDKMYLPDGFREIFRELAVNT